MAKILVVEDEPIIRKGIKMWLEKGGLTVSVAENGKIAKDMLNVEGFDLIVLDVMLPVEDGFAVLSHVRNTLELPTPIIMLTAKSQEDDKILGLNLGADDYMVKPFSNRELEARINANLRMSGAFDKTDNRANLSFIIDERLQVIKKGDIEVECSRKELDLLISLIEVSPDYAKKSTLLKNIWGYLGTEETRTLDIHISKLRKKLAKIGVENVIYTKRGVGFAFEEKE